MPEPDSYLESRIYDRRTPTIEFSNEVPDRFLITRECERSRKAERQTDR